MVYCCNLQKGIFVETNKTCFLFAVDFPSSPTTFRSPNKGFVEEGVVRLAEGESEITARTPLIENEDDDKSLYTATACLPTGRVTLRKGTKKHKD